MIERGEAIVGHSADYVWGRANTHAFVASVCGRGFFTLIAVGQCLVPQFIGTSANRDGGFGLAIEPLYVAVQHLSGQHDNNKNL